VKQKSGQAFREDNVIRKKPAEVARILDAPIQSPHLTLELEQLRSGAEVDISDSWKLNSLKSSPHELSKNVRRAILKASSGEFFLSVHIDNLSKESMADSRRLLRMKQDLYDLAQGLSQEGWMQPYLKFVQNIAGTCYGSSLDAFGAPQSDPVLAFEISLAELRRRSSSIADVRDFDVSIVAS
jgi:hypothetical protein